MEVALPAPTASASLRSSVDLTEEHELSIRHVTSSSPQTSTSVAVTAEQTPSQRRTELIRFCAVSAEFFLVGWQNASIGPLMPAIRAHYGIGFTQASTLFILQSCGTAIGSFSMFPLLDKLGFGKTLVLGGVLHTLATVIQASAPPFPAFVICSFFVGLGLAIGEASCNSYVGAQKRNASRKMGVMHALYGLGAFVSPLSATPFASLKHGKWAFFYIATAGIAVTTALVSTMVFKFKRQDALFAETNEPQHNEDVEDGHEFNILKKLKALVKMPLMHYLALYIGLFIGVENTIGGWVVEFIIDERKGGASAGFISAGFYGGIMLGCVVLLPLNVWLGERRVVFLYGILLLALDVVIWRVPSLVTSAVAVSIVGLLMASLYPICLSQMGRLLPPRLLPGAVGYIAGFGTIGGAIVPTITGALAAKFEIKVMPIVVLVMTTAMVMAWALALLNSRKPKLD
ncbi:MFS general substrate transporter [Auriculariales sp. MPI-PUGE-AT-0066]|nr:MFS general substrate transporter [Auriculariales sp. MPI-PUGE-AT-0066]